MMERFKGMSPDEQQQFIARMKDRGIDTSAFEAALPKKAGAPSRGAASSQQAQTIDALFAPLPTVETRGRAWLYVDKQVKPVTLRLGITDGTYTEVISAQELPETAEVVTGVTGLGTTRALPQQNNGNPLMPGGGRGPGGPGGFGGGGGGGRGGRG